jgi:hypothetical protein
MIVLPGIFVILANTTKIIRLQKMDGAEGVPWTLRVKETGILLGL